MLNINIPALNLDTEEAGKWFPYRGDIKFKIARMDNDAYLAGAAEMYALLAKDLSNTSTYEQADFMFTLYARYILMDWEGVVDNESGDILEYSFDQGKEVLADPKYKDVLSFVLKHSREIDEYWEAKTETVGEQ
jgi:hypothetical protein